MVSKAERKRRKRANKLPELAPVEQKQPHRVNGKFAKQPNDSQKEALQARQRVSGIKAPQKDLAALHGLPHMSHEIGWCMNARGLPRDKTESLWQTFKGLVSAKEIFRKRIVNTSVHPKGASIASVPEPFKTDEAASIDLRSQEEKEKAAVENYKHWNARLMKLSSADRRYLNQMADENGPALWYSGKPTITGEQTLNALERLAKLMQG